MWWIIGIPIIIVLIYFTLPYLKNKKRPIKKIKPSQPQQNQSQQQQQNQLQQQKQNKFQSTFWTILGTLILVLIGIAIIIGISYLFKSCGSDSNTQPSQTEALQKAIQNRVLMFEGFTPCSPTFDYKFHIEVEGPVWEKFPGIDEPIYFDGKSFPTVPARLPGPVEITSANPQKPHVKVRIYQILQ